MVREYMTGKDLPFYNRLEPQNPLYKSRACIEVRMAGQSICYLIPVKCGTRKLMSSVCFFGFFKNYGLPNVHLFVYNI